MANEEPKINPSTGISNFTRKDLEDAPSGSRGESMAEKFIKFANKEDKKVSSGNKKVTAYNILGLKKAKIKKTPMADRLRVLKYSNMLERRRLQMQLERFRLQRKLDLMKRKGQLKEMITRPIVRPTLLYPAFATQNIMGDIDSAFFGDFSHADGNLWGGERYYDEDFYSEDYYGNEFNGSVWDQLGVHPKPGVSPLLW